MQCAWRIISTTSISYDLADALGLVRMGPENSAGEQGVVRWVARERKACRQCPASSSSR